MTTSKLNGRTAPLLGALIALCVAGSQPALATDPNDIPYLFAQAGGPYQGKVGVPVEFDASLSYVDDGSAIEGYYWDWDMDQNYECFSLPNCTHTWHSAFVGQVGMHVFGPGNNMASDEADVAVSGPETILRVVLESTDTDLHVYDPRRRHVGLDYTSGNVDRRIPDSSFQVMMVDGDESDQAPTQTIAMPLYAAGDYRIRLVGTRNESFRLVVAALRDGKPLVEQAFAGEIAEGESIVLNVYAACPGGQLDMMCGELALSPGLEVEPAQIELTVEPDAVYDVTLQVRETHGKVPLESVTFQCGDIVRPGNRIPASNITFDLNNFTVDAGSEQEVHVRIAVPVGFQGKVTGSISVKSSTEVGTSIPLTLKTPGTRVPVAVANESYEGTVGEPVCFDVSGCYDPDGYIEQYAWDWDNDGHIDQYTMMPTICHTWDAEFSGPVTFYVFDNDALVNAMSVEVTVTAPAIP